MRRGRVDGAVYLPLNSIMAGAGSDLDHETPIVLICRSGNRSELATMMLDLAKTYPEYRRNAAKVRLVEVTAAKYYGKGYQDVQNRVPGIANTCADLDWQPRVAMAEALKRIFDAYRGQVAAARHLVD